MSELLEGLLAPLRAVLVALVGLWLAWQWSEGALLQPALVVLAVFALGYLFELIGRHLLPKRPVAAVFILECWILSPLMLAAAASALVVVAAIALGVPDSAPQTTKELTKVLAAALTAFLTSGFVSWAGEQESSFLARRIQHLFIKKYQRPVTGKLAEPGVKYFRPESSGERWVQSESFQGISGWGHNARLARARGIAEELRTHNSDPPSSPTA